MKTTRWVVTLVILLVPMIFLVTGRAGNLEPSAPPGPTMKTLDQVEPRIPIGPETTPGDANSLYKITQSGSYYLTSNFTSNFKHGIMIEATDVTIDLMGYRIWSSWAVLPPGATTDFDGIYIVPGSDNVEIRNGTIASDRHTQGIIAFRGFRYGIYAPHTASPPFVYSNNINIKNVRVTGSRGSGIYSAGISRIDGCTISENVTSALSGCQAIYAGEKSIVSNNNVCHNGTSAPNIFHGISTGGQASVTGNTVCGNGISASSNVYGIYIYSAGTIINNTVARNGESASGKVQGIFADGGSTVANNTVYYNGRDAGGVVCGIYTEMNCTVTGNTASYNRYFGSGIAYGIYAEEGCTVNGNTACDNGHNSSGEGYGIHLEGNSLVDRNTAYANNGTNMNDPGTCTFGLNHAP